MCNLQFVYTIIPGTIFVFYMPLPSFFGKKNTPGISALQAGAPGPYYKWVYP